MGYRLPVKSTTLNDLQARFKVIDTVNATKLMNYSLLMTLAPCIIAGGIICLLFCINICDYLPHRCTLSDVRVTNDDVVSYGHLRCCLALFLTISMCSMKKACKCFQHAMLRRAQCCYSKSSVRPSVSLRYCDLICWKT